MTDMTNAQPPVVSREAIARIIAPTAWKWFDQDTAKGIASDHDTAVSLQKADAILALSTSKAATPPITDEMLDAGLRTLRGSTHFDCGLILDIVKDTLGAATSDEAVPEGWRLVPVKLADEMHEAVVSLDFTSTHDPLWPEYWSTLLAAAPTPPASEARGRLIELIRQEAFWHGAPSNEAAATRIADQFFATGAGESVEAVPADVRRLVIAAREFYDRDAATLPWQDERQELEDAAEAFASRVPWDDGPAINQGGQS